jgi:hypothetical protein
VPARPRDVPAGDRVAPPQLRAVMHLLPPLLQGGSLVSGGRLCHDLQGLGGGTGGRCSRWCSRRPPPLTTARRQRTSTHQRLPLRSAGCARLFLGTFAAGRGRPIFFRHPASHFPGVPVSFLIEEAPPRPKGGANANFTQPRPGRRPSPGRQGDPI